MFRDMFIARSDTATAASRVDCALRLPREVGAKMLLDLPRHDTNRLATALAELHVPVLAIKATCANEKRERRSLNQDDSTERFQRSRRHGIVSVCVTRRR